MGAEEGHRLGWAEGRAVRAGHEADRSRQESRGWDWTHQREKALKELLEASAEPGPGHSFLPEPEDRSGAPAPLSSPQNMTATKGAANASSRR